MRAVLKTGARMGARKSPEAWGNKTVMAWRATKTSAALAHPIAYPLCCFEFRYEAEQRKEREAIWKELGGGLRENLLELWSCKNL